MALPSTRYAPLLVALLLAWLGASQSSTAQSLWTKPYTPNQVTLELLQPALDVAPDEELSLLTGAAVLGSNILLNERTTLVAEVPFAHYDAQIGDDDPASVTESAIGNPYVGLGVSSTRVPLLVELGLRLPLLSDSNAATWAGAASDLDHSEAFAPHLLSAQALLNTRWEFSRVTSVRLRGGPLLTVPTQDDGSSAELFARYSAQGWYEGDRYVLGLGLTGRALLTERALSFTDRTTHQLGATLIFNFSAIQPGLLLRAPLNGPGSDDVDLVVGVTLSVSL